MESKQKSLNISFIERAKGMGVCICSNGDRLNNLIRLFENHGLECFGNVNLEDYEEKTLFSLIDMEKDGFHVFRPNNLTLSRKYYMTTFYYHDNFNRHMGILQSHGFSCSLKGLQSIFRKEIINDYLIPCERMLESEKDIKLRNSIRIGVHSAFLRGF